MMPETDVLTPRSTDWCCLSATGLAITGEPTFDEWHLYGQYLYGLGTAIQWALGDWLSYGERRYGETYADAIDLTQKSYQTLANCAWVAGRFEPSRRRETLSWSHHAEVARLPPAEADALLDAAAREGWDRDTLRERVRALRDREPTDSLALSRAIDRSVSAIRKAVDAQADADLAALFEDPLAQLTRLAESLRPRDSRSATPRTSPEERVDDVALPDIAVLGAAPGDECAR